MRLTDLSQDELICIMQPNNMAGLNPEMDLDKATVFRDQAALAQTARCFRSALHELAQAYVNNGPTFRLPVSQPGASIMQQYADTHRAAGADTSKICKLWSLHINSDCEHDAAANAEAGEIAMDLLESNTLIELEPSKLYSCSLALQYVPQMHTVDDWATRRALLRQIFDRQLELA